MCSICWTCFSTSRTFFSPTSEYQMASPKQLRRTTCTRILYWQQNGEDSRRSSPYTGLWCFKRLQETRRQLVRRTWITIGPWSSWHWMGRCGVAILTFNWWKTRNSRYVGFAYMHYQGVDVCLCIHTGFIGVLLCVHACLCIHTGFIGVLLCVHACLCMHTGFIGVFLCVHACLLCTLSVFTWIWSSCK